MGARTLPVDIWLLVFAHTDDANFLWSTCRNVDRFLRACVDEHFGHGILRRTLLALDYADFHAHRGPEYCQLHIPMAFDRLSTDGKRAVFQQRLPKKLFWMYPRGPISSGSLRGWLPFMERYCAETGKPTPTVLNASKPADGSPLWEQELAYWRNTLHGTPKKTYLLSLGDMSGIGRGDRPPFYLRVCGQLNDTELVGLVVDCARGEVSIDWRDTYSHFFLEQEFVARTCRRPGKKRVYDRDLSAVASRYPHTYKPDGDNHVLRARHKRLRSWTRKNKHRMSPEVRLRTEHRVRDNMDCLRHILRPENFEPFRLSDTHAASEVVPARLAEDHPDLLFWPWGDEHRYFVPTRRPLCERNCVIL